MILVFGTICIDRIRRVPRLPSPGGYVEIEEELLLLGGEAANTANALNLWADSVVLAGNRIGESVEGDLLKSLIEAKGLGPALLRRDSGGDPVAAPVCDIYVTPDGERTMFGKGFDGASPEIDPANLPYQAGNWFTADPNMSEHSRTAAKLARDAGMRTYLMDFIREAESLQPGSYWQSSTDWAGHRNNMQRNVQWVKEWASRHGCYTVLSDGPNGFVFGGPDRPVRAYPPFPAPAVVDTTGAGDLFRAGMVHGLSAGWSVPDCLRFASAAGCLKCRALGGTTDVPSASEIAEYIAANPDVAAAYGSE